MTAKKKTSASMQKKEPLIAHLAELRKRILYSFLTVIIFFFPCYGFAKDIFGFLVQPFADAVMEVSGSTQHKLISTGLAETFFAYIKVSFYLAFCLSLPVIIYQFWRFIEPGLYRHEKKAVWPFMVMGPVLFVTGAALAYYLVMPLAWKFFLEYEAIAIAGSVNVEMMPKVSQYLAMTLKMLFAFGLCFQLPIFITLFASVGLASSRGLRQKRKYAVIIVLIVAAILTPPDIISQLLLAFPLMFLYEVSVFLAAMVEKKK